MIKVYVANLGAYNRGQLIGQWLKLPMAEEDLQKVIGEVLGKDEEYAIHDYVAPFTIGEYISIHDLNNLIQEVKEIGIDQDIFFALCKSHSSHDFKEVLQDIIDGDFTIHEVNTNTMLNDEEDVALNLYEEGLINFLGKIPAELISYIDWESVWRDCNLEYGWNRTVINNRTFAVNIK